MPPGIYFIIISGNIYKYTSVVYKIEISYKINNFNFAINRDKL